MRKFIQFISLVCFSVYCYYGYGQISGTVYRDYNYNGTRQTLNPNEPGIEGIIVNAYNGADVLIASYLTGVNGTYSIPNTGSVYNGTEGSNTGFARSGLKVRLEFVVPNTNVVGSNTYMSFPTAISSQNGSSVQFITSGASAINVNYGVNNPADYSNANPRIVYNTYVEGNQTAGSNANRITLNYMMDSLGNVAGSSSTGKIPVATAAQIGTTYGIAHQKSSNSVFTTALMKRHTGFGPAGTGGIYRSDLTAGTTTTFLDINTLLGAGTAGVNPHPTSATASFWLKDSAAWDVVGKIAFGDLDISEDELTLWTINLADRKLYQIPLGSVSSPVAPAAGQIGRFPVSGDLTSLAGLVGTNLATDIRPYAVAVRNGLVYVGIVHTSQTAQLTSELRAFVYSFNPSTQVFTKVLEFPLNYPRHFAVNDGANSAPANWQPWKSTFTVNVNPAFGNEYSIPQPILADISFNGDIMQLGFRDRYGDQMGFAQRDLNGAGSYSGTTAGDLLLASPDGFGNWTIESNAESNPAGAFGPSLGVGNAQGLGNGEFFFRDKFPISQTSYTGPTFIMHDEVITGGIAQIPGYTNVITASLDPADDFNSAFDAGISWFNNTTGDRAKAFMVFNGGATNDPYFGKANGLGDIEYVSPPSPMEIGNRVWNDYDEDGVQDADEKGIANVNLELYADFNTNGVPDGAALATTITNASGVWAFNATNILDGDPTTIGFQGGLKAGAQYIVGVAGTDWNGASGLGALTGFYLSPTNSTNGTGVDEWIDNDAAVLSTFPQISTPIGVAGESKHEFDFGFFMPKMTIGDYVWVDANKDGIQDANETGASGITVTLINASNNRIVSVVKTDATGHYYFNDITEGSYEIQVSLPTDYAFSPTTGGNESTDSDVLTYAGRTGAFTVSPFQDTLGIDAGIYFESTTKGTFGDYVWYDANQDGIQDASERGVANVTVTLYNASGTAVMTTKTDQTGKYLFQNIAAAGYAMGITPPVGYTFSPIDQGGDDNLDSDISATSGRTSLTNIIAGEEDLSWDVGLVPQTASKGSIGDRVWNDVNKDGIQDVGEPGIGSVLVILYNGLNTAVDSTYTDAYGNYIFHNIDGGSYYLFFSLTSGYSYSLSNQGTNDDIDNDVLPSGNTARILLGAGENLTNIDAAMFINSPAGTSSIGDRVWMDGDLDGLQGANEAGVAGVTVILLNNTYTPVDNTVTDSKGNYRFVQLAAGNYYVQFTNLPRGFSCTAKDIDGGAGDATDSNPNQGNGITDVISLGTGDNNMTIDAGIIPKVSNNGMGSIGNFVWYDTDRDGIQDATEPGVSNVNVTLTNLTTSTSLTLTTDGAGYYLFNSLSAGNYRLTFTTPAGYSFSLVDQGGDDSMDSDVDGTGNTGMIVLTDGELNNSIDAGMYITSLLNPATVGDLVWMDSNMNGVQEVGESGMPGIGVTLYDVNEIAIQNTTTDHGGNYYFAGLQAGTYSIGFHNLPSGFDFSTQDNSADDNLDSDADIRTGLTDAFDLVTGQTLLSIDAAVNTTTKAALGNYVWYDKDTDGLQNNSGQGAPGMTVVLVDGINTPIATAITDAQGFYFFPNLDANTYAIQMANLPPSTKFTLQNVGGAVNENKDSDINPATGISDAVSLVIGTVNLDTDAGLGAPITSTIRGYFWYDYVATGMPTNSNGLQDTDEKPAAGATIGLYDITGSNLISTTVTDGNGNYVFQNVLADTYTIKSIALPLGTRFTVPNAGGANDSTDSDFLIATANAGNYTVGSGQDIEGADGGLIPAATAQGLTFTDGKPNMGNTADGIRNHQIPTDTGSPMDMGFSDVIVQLVDETGTLLASTRTDDTGEYRFAGLESGKSYNIIFEPNPSNCLLCDFTFYNVEVGNDTTDSDVDTTYTMNYFAKSFALADTLKNLSPNENRKNIDAGYSQPGSAFPVELLFLAAEWQGPDGLVTWKTTKEVNSKYFSVERSLDNGNSFAWIGNVVAAGASTETKSYGFTDIGVKFLTDKQVYYRLKMVDIDASYKYSNLVELKADGAVGDIYFHSYPNPTQDIVYVDYHVMDANIIEIRVVNELGQIVYSEEITNDEKPGQIYLDVRDFPSGFYSLQLNTISHNLVRKLIKN